MTQAWWEVKLDLHLEEESRVTKTLRMAVLRRDLYGCRKCGDEDLEQLAVHHVVFRSMGGGHTVDNLVTLCGKCHADIHAHRLDVKKVDEVWYFRDNLLQIEDIKYAPYTPTPLVVIRLRRYSGGSSARWRSAQQRGGISARYRRIQ